jgi:hypothetical protein
MRFYIRFIFFLCILFISGSVLFSCSKPKEGKVIVSEQEFAVRKLSKYAYTIDAKGKVKNVGEVDVKKIVVTGTCKTCATGLAPGKWTIVESSERERSPEEQDMINYLVVGCEDEFSFTDVAVIYNTVPEEPDEMPEDLEVVVVSFEIVD